MPEPEPIDDSKKKYIISAIAELRASYDNRAKLLDRGNINLTIVKHLVRNVGEITTNQEKLMECANELAEMKESVWDEP